MIRNYLKTSLRYLSRHKEYTVINIIGLAVSIACCILIMFFVRGELSYDTFHSRSERLYRIWQREGLDGKIFENAFTSLPLADAMKSNFPEIENSSRIYSFRPIVKVGQNSFTDKVNVVDPSFFQMFDFPVIHGNAKNPLSLNNSVIITATTAKKYFGSDNPIGRTVEIQLGNDKVLFTVTGIVNEAPDASSIKFHLLISFANAPHLFKPAMFKDWFNIFPETYVLLKPDANPSFLQTKIPAMLKQQMGSDFTKEDYTLHLQAIKDIHLDTSLPTGNEPINDPKYVYILTVIGLLILIIACINFITLSIGSSANRALEVGVRKTLGAERSQLIFQFWGEAFLTVLFSVAIGLCLAGLLLKPFNTLLGRQFTFQFDLIFIVFSVLMIALIAIIAGIYPALILSGFNPIEILKGKLNAKGGGSWRLKGLVVGQFLASITMMIATIVIGLQVRYLQTKDLGYKKNQVVIVETNKSRKEGLRMAELYRSELIKHPQVVNASVSYYSFAETPWIHLGYTDENKEYKSLQFNAIDANFITLMGIKIINGRNFEQGNAADIAGSVLINEAYVKDFNLTDPVGKKLPGPFPQQIIGVVKDFNFESLHTRVQPLVMSVNADSLIRHAADWSFTSPPQPRISVLLKAENLSANINLLKQAWSIVAPGQEFDYKFLDDAVANQYQQEQRTNVIIQIASVLSIFISCMGLFGFATLSVVKRSKEIGIRKVMGANVSGIVRLLSIDFIKLVIIAAIIASPIAWWAMNRWLEDFTYHISIHWWVFILAGLAAMFIALATVSYNAIKAALVNPVKGLRSE